MPTFLTWTYVGEHATVREAPAVDGDVQRIKAGEIGVDDALGDVTILSYPRRHPDGATLAGSLLYCGELHFLIFTWCSLDVCWGGRGCGGHHQLLHVNVLVCGRDLVSLPDPLVAVPGTPV